MTDTTTTSDPQTAESNTTTDDSGADDWPEPDEPTDTGDGPDLNEWVELGGLFGLIMLGAVAAVGFYTSAGTAISRLVTPEYEPIFQAVFNLVVLLIALIGVSLLLRRRAASTK